MIIIIIIIIWTYRNKPRWNSYRNSNILIEEKAFEISSGKWRLFFLGINVLKRIKLLKCFDGCFEDHWSILPRDRHVQSPPTYVPRDIPNKLCLMSVHVVTFYNWCLQYCYTRKKGWGKARHNTLNYLDWGLLKLILLISASSTVLILNIIYVTSIETYILLK